MRHYLWIAAVLAGAALAGTGCSSTGSQPASQTSSASDDRGPIGNGAFGEAVPAESREPATPHVAASGGADVQGHGFTGNGAFGEAP